jgi:hypothetical protein
MGMIAFNETIPLMRKAFQERKDRVRGQYNEKMQEHGVEGKWIFIAGHPPGKPVSTPNLMIL